MIPVCNGTYTSFCSCYPGRLVVFLQRGSILAAKNLASICPGVPVSDFQKRIPSSESSQDSVLPDGLFYLILKKPYWLAPLRGSGAPLNNIPCDDCEYAVLE